MGGFFINKKIFTILFILTVIFSLSAVYANDTNDTSIGQTSNILTSQDVDEDLSISQNDFLNEQNGNLSFSDLSTTINSANNNVELNDDYSFDDAKDGDYINGIVIKKNNFVINGNNHVIDAKNKAGLFTIIGTNVTINNLILKNSNNRALNISGTVITTNVTFMNCSGNYDQGGAVYLSKSEYISINDKFIDDYAKYGSAIYSRNSNMTISNATFKNANRIVWGLIYAYDSTWEVLDTTFTNITSKYATAIFSTYGVAKIKRSKFNNLFANVTAGAVGLKIGTYIIEDCEFINVSSSKNGGAVFVDLDVYDGNVSVINTKFENCSSEFGGAYLQLSGDCLITNSTFKNNFADYDGGAFYISSLDKAEIINCTFEDNNVNLTHGDYVACGGALFLDNSPVNVSDCKFTNNHAVNASAIYLYDCTYNLTNLVFNGNGNPIFSYIDDEFCVRSNLSGNDPISDDDFNNTYYPDGVFGPGKQLVIKDTSNITDLPSKFNLVDYNWVTPVKDQGTMASCWAFGIIGALESALLKATGVTYDFSENNLQNLMMLYSKYGSTQSSESGTASLGYAYLLNWFGVISHEYDEYDELGKISPLITTGNDIHVQDIVLIPYGESLAEGITNVKKAIVEYGALMGVLSFGATAFDGQPSTYNEETFALYNPDFNVANHGICVVGWDDDFSKDNFINEPEGDGAWIIKNSWGTEWGDNGYFYVSYYDQTLCPYDEFSVDTAFVGVKIENTIPYNKNYEYDFIGIYGFTDDKVVTTGVNYYVAYEDDVIAAVGTYLLNDTNYTLEIIVNDSVVYTQEGVASYFGYHTIKLDNYVSIKKGDRFGAAISTKDYSTISFGSRVKLQKGVSLSYNSDGFTTDISAENRGNCIKIYTLPESFKVEKIVEYYSINNPLRVDVNKSNVQVTISFENQNITNTTDEHGVATFALPLMEHGTHVIYVKYNDTVVITTVTVVSTIDIPDEIKAGCNANSNTTINFYDANGTKLNSITIPIPNQIGSYNLSFTNYVTGEVRNSTIKVISRFDKNEDLTTYYGVGQYLVRVVGDDGNPVEGEIITFKIMGLTCEVETNNAGLAAVLMPLDLTMGTYTITATYKGDTVKNTVKILQPLSSKDVSVKISDNKLVLEATLFGERPYENETVTFKFAGKTYSAIVDKNGTARITLNNDVIKTLKAGNTYPVEISYYNDTIKASVKVLQPLTSQKVVTVQLAAKKLVLKASLKYGKTPLENTKVTFKFRGKTYSAKTDKNGIAQITLNKKVIKKLKAGKTYPVEISYLTDTIKTSVKVEHMLASKKLVTVKKSAKKFTLKAKLKINKKPVKGKKITFKFKGKKYTAKTNKKGIAKLKIKKNVIKKLKKGKKYAVKISYLTETIKTTVKVKK